MFERIELTKLVTSTPASSGEVRTGEALRGALITTDPDQEASTQLEGREVTITSSGEQLTVAQVLAEFEIMFSGE